MRGNICFDFFFSLRRNNIYILIVTRFFKFNFIFTLSPCLETLITNSKQMSFISNWFTLEIEGKISLLVTFIQRSEHYSYNAYKNADGNWKFNITKLNPWKLTFWKQPVIAKDEIRVSVILANKSEVTAKNFIIPISF